MKELGMKKRRILWILGMVLLAGAGGAAALFLSNRRDVTTTSRAAYEAYREATLNESRFYFKEARVGFAKALELDPTFAMAMLGLARQSSDRDQHVTLIKRAARERSRLTERERLHVDLNLADVEKNRDGVLKAARDLHAKYPDDVRGAMVLAGEQLAKGNPDQAIKIFEEVLAVDPNNAEAYNQIGYYYGYRGDYERAIDNLTKYQFISSDNANPFDSLGENQAYSGRYNEAIENLNRALAIKADFAPAYQHLGVAYEGMGEYAKAVQSYEKAAELDGTGSMRRDYLTLAVRAALIGGDSAAARTLLERIGKLPIDPKSEYARVGPAFMAVLLDLSQGKAADAERRLKELKPALETLFAENSKAGKLPPAMKPHYPQWNFLMALALEKQGRADEALTIYELNANPPNPFYDFDSRRWIMEARAKVAEILARRGDLEKAEKLIAENRKWNPSWGPCRPAEAAVAELRRAKVLAASK
jgi:tetratricopeptide (TPR) repeat protein